MKLKRLDPPAKRSQKLVSLYDQLITPEMVRMTRAHPGETFALVDPHYWARVDAQKKEK